MDTLNDRAIRAGGTSESAWTPWLAGQAIREVPMEELCPDQSRLVIVAPHPDDEVLACGGLLAMRAERKLPFLIIAVTDGEASHGAGEPMARSRLGARRAEESRSGLQSMGVHASSVVRLGLPDGGVAHFADTLTEELGPLLKPTDVVLSTWHLDGHPDHEAASTAVQRAAVGAACRYLQAPVWMWHWAKPGDSRIPWSSLVAFRLTEQAVSAKHQALRCHHSQWEARGDHGPVLMPSIVERAARPQEFFFR